MTLAALLTGPHLLTYQAILGGAPARNATWSDVRALLDQLGQVTVDPQGNLTIARHGRVLELHPAQTKDVGESGELGALRRFLEQPDPTVARAPHRDPHLLVVIHRDDMRLYRCQVIGGLPQLILPLDLSEPAADPSVARRPRSRPKPAAPIDVFASTVEALQIAGQIVVVSVGQIDGANLFVERLKQHDSALSARIIGTLAVDEQHLAPVDLLAAARKLYATLTA